MCAKSKWASWTELEYSTSQDSSSREINTSTGRQLRDNEAPSWWLSAEMLGKDNGSQEQNTSSFEAENDDNVADAAFYSGYVSLEQFGVE